MVDPWLSLALAFAGAVAPAFLFGFDGRRWPLVGLSGVLGWATYLGILALGGEPWVALFAGSCAVAAWTEVLALVLGTPLPAVLVGGVFPLVPGLTAFQALEALLKDENALAGQRGGEALGAAVSIALGVLAITGLARLRRIPEKKSKVNRG